MNVDVVIGAAYGDEGKGATVNRLATEQSVVVRFNGGCQAGHTVEHNGIRHVFSHFGAGTLRGAETYLSSFFVTSPLAFYNERRALRGYGITPKVSISADCLVTTPWDMLLNRALEDSRGDKRHGSVGVGFNETIERCQHEQFKLTIDDLHNEPLLDDKLHDIAYKWVYQRAGELDIDIGESLKQYDCNPDDIWHLCNMMLNNINVVYDESTFMKNTIEKDRHVVFEGAQGLMLDQTYGTFPYVTRSNCGLKNVLELVPEYSDIRVIYVTRSYTTRHGAGPLPHESDIKPYPGIVDNTNLPHGYQGSLRFSYLNLDTLHYSINCDIDHVYNDTEHSIFACGHMTCLNQLPKTGVGAIVDGKLIATTPDELYAIYLHEVGLEANWFCNV
jgi:adenylosuccinate synthase